MPDLPGFGGMDSFYKIGKKPTLDNMADYLASYIKLRYKKQRFTLLGLSLGFMIITRMLQKYPEIAKQVDDLVSFAGFAHKKDFKYKKSTYYLFLTATWFFSRRLPAAFIKYIILRRPFIKLGYAVFEPRLVKAENTKIRGTDKEERDRRIDFEVHLWQCNDLRTYMDIAHTMFTLDLTKEHVDHDVIHIAIAGDRYFNNLSVEQHMRMIFKDFNLVKAKPPAHAPSIIASAKEAAPFFPPSLRRILNRKDLTYNDYKMKIALVCPFNMLDRPGGVPQVIIHLYLHLKKRGHEVKIITQRPSSFKGEVPEDYVLFGITRTFKANGLGTEGNWGMPSDSNEIAAYFKEQNFDVVNVHEPWIPWLALQIVRNSHSVYVATFHANLVDTPGGKVWTSNLFTPFGRPFVEKMHLLTATSPASAAALLNMADMKRPHDRMLIKNLRYLPVGVELSSFKPVKKRKPLSGAGTKTIVYVGRIEKRKGVEYLIDAFSELVERMPEARLIIAGQGVQAKKLQQRVDYDEIPNVTFTGYVSDAEKIRLLQNADLACFPATQGEGFGITLLEAMACGTPMLAGNNLGYINVMKGHGRIGLFDPTATKDFANRLEVFLTDGAIRKLMVDWALKEVKQYDYPKIADQYEAAYKAAIEIRRTYGHRPKESVEKNGKKKRKAFRRFSLRRHS